jgi:RimJ/RimL family protein N-acetyltransferase
MKEGQVITRLFIERRGKMEEIVIRFPKKSDLEQTWKFYNKVIKETEFLSNFKPVSRKREKEWLEKMLEGMRKKNTALLFAESKGKIVGSCQIDNEISDMNKHIGNYGICILREFSGFGIGTKLTELVLQLAKKEMRTEIAKLSVYHKNRIAMELYKKTGFRHAGKIPRGGKRGARYMDMIIMYKVLK